MTAVLLLSSHLTEDTAKELLAAATHKSKAEVERLLAERFPKPDLPTALAPVPAPRPSLEVIDTMAPRSAELALDQVDASSIPGPVRAPAVAGLRLRCRAHNHSEAERTFGAEFMRRRREKARAPNHPG